MFPMMLFSRDISTTLSIVKFGGGNIMAWGIFSFTVRIHKIEGAMDDAMYWKILEMRIRRMMPKSVEWVICLYLKEAPGNCHCKQRLLH